MKDILCDICKQANETVYLPIYTSGSEGTYLCIECRILLANYINSLKRIRNKGFKDAFIFMKKTKENIV